MNLNEIDPFVRFKFPLIRFGDWESRCATDSTECKIERPGNDDVQRYSYSGYKKAHTFKWLTITLLEIPYCIPIDGPWRGPANDFQASVRSRCRENGECNWR